MKSLINYFRELLQILKSIDKSLKMISDCVASNERGHGKKHYISTGHWND